MLYLLIPATLVVWGLIIQKIIKNMDSGENPAAMTAPLSVLASEEISDTFSIHPSYRDPFLRKLFIKQEASTQPVHKSTPPPPPVKVITPWPTIVFNGIIRNQKSNKEMVLLQVNGQDHMLKVGETAGDVLLYKSFKDSIEVHFLKEKKIIHK